MATLTLIAAAPFDDPPGVRLDDIDMPVLHAAPIRAWVDEHAGHDIYVAGHDDQIAGYYRTLDIPVTAEEYLEVVASAR